MPLSFKKFALFIQYDGTNYHGWQKQKSLPSIQGVIEEVLSELLQEEIHIKGASRTDAGVHALCQVAVFKTKKDIKEEKLLKSINACLPEDIMVWGLKEVSQKFDPINDALEKTYGYFIFKGSTPPPFIYRYVLPVSFPIKVDSMRKTSALFLGKQDFSFFMNKGTKVSSCVREIRELKVMGKKNIIGVFITADGFLKQMVRNIIGTMLMVEMGKLKFEEVENWNPPSPSRGFRFTAPARGLFLLDIKFQKNLPFKNNWYNILNKVLGEEVK